MVSKQDGSPPLSSYSSSSPPSSSSPSVSPLDTASTIAEIQFVPQLQIQHVTQNHSEINRGIGLNFAAWDKLQASGAVSVPPIKITNNVLNASDDESPKNHHRKLVNQLDPAPLINFFVSLGILFLQIWSRLTG